MLETAAQELQATPEEVKSKVSSLLKELAKTRKQLQSMEAKLAKGSADSLLSQAELVDGISILSVKVSAMSPDAMRELGDRLKEKLGSAVIVLGSVYNEKPTFVAMVTPDLITKGFNAGEIVKQAAKVTGGGGGGKAELGQGSGRDKNKVDQALEESRHWIEGHIKDTSN